MFDEYFNLGVISKVFSFKGEVIVRFDLNYPEILNNLTAFFLEINGELVPHQIEELTFQKKNFAKVKLQGVNTEQEAKNIVRTKIYLPDEFLPKLNNDEFYHHEIIGYTVFDQNNVNLGIISQVFDLPANPLIEILINNKEVLIPLSLLEKLNKEKREIKVVIPNGLLDV
jgi:16S rRNA processing protein RimM